MTRPMDEIPDGSIPRERIPELLIALLYGELEPAQAGRVRARIEADPELKKEWEELCGTRDFFRTWEIPEHSPRIVVVHRPEPPGREPKRMGVRLRSLRRWPFAPVFGPVLAAAMLLVLALVGVRVERVDRGIALRFEPRSGQRTELRSEHIGPEGVGLGVAGKVAELAQSPRLTAEGPVETEPATYITRDEMDEYCLALGKTVLSAMNDYDRDKDSRTATLVQASLGGVSSRQEQDYRDLRTRIDQLGTGLLEEQARTRAQVDYLMEQYLKDRSEPLGRVPAGSSKGDDHE